MLRIERNLERDYVIVLVLNRVICSIEFSIDFEILLVVNKSGNLSNKRFLTIGRRLISFERVLID